MTFEGASKVTDRDLDTDVRDSPNREPERDCPRLPVPTLQPVLIKFKKIPRDPAEDLPDPDYGF